MKMNLKTALGAALIAMAIGVPSVVSAEDALRGTRATISQERELHGDAFDAVNMLRSRAPEMDRQKRGRYAIMGPLLEALGPDATMAMADELLRDTPFEGMRPSVRRGWRAGLLHAMGRAYDGRLRPVFAHVLETESDLELVRVAAIAMGKLLDDESARILVTLASQDSDRGRAIVAGIGTCRREIVARLLANRLAKTDSGEEAAPLIEALRDVGNSLAWTTSRVKKSGESASTRDAAATALIDAYLRLPAEESRIVKALMIVDAPNASGIIAKASKALEPDQAKRLDQLAARLEKNPLRRKR